VEKLPRTARLSQDSHCEFPRVSLNIPFGHVLQIPFSNIFPGSHRHMKLLLSCTVTKPSLQTQLVLSALAFWSKGHCKHELCPLNLVNEKSLQISQLEEPDFAKRPGGHGSPNTLPPGHDVPPSQMEHDEELSCSA
jgi:hypothetical protein